MAQDCCIQVVGRLRSTIDTATLKQYECVERYVVATCKAISNVAGKDKIKAQQVQHLKAPFDQMSALGKLKVDIADVTAIQQRLAVPSAAFSDQQREHLASHLATTIGKCQ